MAWYIVRRTALGAVSLVSASVVVFALLRLLPGDVATTIGGDEATPRQLAALRAELGPDRPLPLISVWCPATGLRNRRGSVPGPIARSR